MVFIVAVLLFAFHTISGSGGTFQKFLIILIVVFFMFLFLKRFVTEKLIDIVGLNFSKPTKGLFTLFILIVVLMLNIYVLRNIPFGINLPFGWAGSCYESNTGFPFLVLSYPPPGSFCGGVSTNVLGSVLNLVFLEVLVFSVVQIISKRIRAHN